jgi:hypothetical protein
LKRPRRVCWTRSSNHGAPRIRGSERVTGRVAVGCARSSADCVVVSSSLLSLPGRRPSSARRSWSSSSRLPTVREMCSASSRVRSFQDERGVPQYPQKTRRWSPTKGEAKDRWILECVSSGNCANVADVYHARGTRSQSVSGLAAWCPAMLSV